MSQVAMHLDAWLLRVIIFFVVLYVYTDRIFYLFLVVFFVCPVYLLICAFS